MANINDVLSAVKNHMDQGGVVELHPVGQPPSAPKGQIFHRADISPLAQPPAPKGQNKATPATQQLAR